MNQKLRREYHIGIHFEIMIELEKKILRGNLKKLRNSLSDEERDVANLAICNYLSQLNKIMRAEVIAAYMPMRDEVDLADFFAKFAEKQFCFPRCKAGGEKNKPLYEMAMIPGLAFRNSQLTDFFKTGKYGIFEPNKEAPVIPVDKIDLWLIPGVGFDTNGNRLGRGGGFYDRLLENAPGIKIGVGYDIQLISEIPCGEHDQLMDIFIGSSKVLEFERS